MNVVVICESNFLNNSSGINTFINHLTTMLEKFNLNTYLVVSDLHNFEDIYTYKEKNITILSDSEYDSCLNVQTLDQQDKYIESFFKTIRKNIPNDNNIFISNSYSSTKVFEKLVDFYPKSKFYAYTHVGDIFSPTKEDLYDFSEDMNTEYLKTLRDNDFIKILTQTDCMNDRLSYIIDRDDILTIPEPLYIDDVYDIGMRDDNILIVCSNYKRKRFDLMLKYVGLSGKPVKILCYKEDGYYDIKELLLKNNIKKYIIIENINNKNVSFHTLMSKMLLHFSEIEVCPYSILEASSIIPSVINSNAQWTKSFSKISEMVDYDNEKNVLDAIGKIYSNEITKKFNLEKYQYTFENTWSNLFL